MPTPLKLRRRFFPWILPLLLFAAFGAFYLHFWGGGDTLLSLLVSRALGVRTEFSRVRMSGWNELRFEKAEVAGRDSERLVASGAGSLRFGWRAREWPEMRFYIQKAVLEAALFSRFVGEGAVKDSPLLSRGIAVTDVRLDLRRSSGALELRLRSLRSSDLQAQGGMRWRAGRLELAHGMLRLSRHLSEQMPKEWMERFPAGPGGERLVKGSFRNSRVTLFGRSGPLLRASWEMAYTTGSP